MTAGLIKCSHGNDHDARANITKGGVIRAKIIVQIWQATIQL